MATCIRCSRCLFSIDREFYIKCNNRKELSWNVSSKNNSSISVFKLVSILNSFSNKKVKLNFIKKKKFLETNKLNINPNKIQKIIGWKNKLKIKKSIYLTLLWYLKYFKKKKNSYKITVDQIKNYLYSN